MTIDYAKILQDMTHLSCEDARSELMTILESRVLISKDNTDTELSGDLYEQEHTVLKFGEKKVYDIMTTECDSDGGNELMIRYNDKYLIHFSYGEIDYDASISTAMEDFGLKHVTTNDFIIFFVMLSNSSILKFINLYLK